KSQGQSSSAASPSFVGVNLALLAPWCRSPSQHDEVLLEFERQVGPSPPLIHRHSLTRIAFLVKLGTIPRGPATVPRLGAPKRTPHRHRGNRHRPSGRSQRQRDTCITASPSFEDLEL